MRREALVLIFAMLAGTLQMAACDQREERKVVMAPAQGPQAVEPTAPRAELGAPTAAESKEAAVPMQGEIDPKEPAQIRDFEQKK
jgi:hypothetical protein